MSEIQIVNPLNYPEWDELVISDPACSFFHSSSWARVLAESYGYRPYYFTVFDGEGKLLALIPIMEIRSILTGRRGVSLPFSDYCEPITKDERQFQDLMNAITRYGKRSGWRYVEMRGGERWFKGISSSSYYYGHTLDLAKDQSTVFNNFRDSTRRNIKRAIKEGVEVRICHSLDSVREFYRLNCLTRRQHGLPPQPFSFFKRVYDHIISKKRGMVVLASYKGRITASAVFIHLGEKAFYKYGASDVNYQSLRANNLVMWEAIKCYCTNEYKFFCFGRTEPDNEGLLQFKAGWRPEKRILNYFRYDLKGQSFVKNVHNGQRIPRTLMTKMPPIFLQIIGSFMYRHVG